jgi:hypothetical protein
LIAVFLESSTSFRAEWSQLLHKDHLATLINHPLEKDPEDWLNARFFSPNISGGNPNPPGVHRALEYLPFVQSESRLSATIRLPGAAQVRVSKEARGGGEETVSTAQRIQSFQSPLIAFSERSRWPKFRLPQKVEKKREPPE